MIFGKELSEKLTDMLDKKCVIQKKYGRSFFGQI